jgi:glycosyltransferase involved in cell wall biosynthesis
MERYLKQCVTSLLIPSIDDIEVLIINDGSKDKTSEIGHEFADKFPNSIRVIDKENGHYGSCINRGLAEATGKYIRVLDADDSCHSENLIGFVNFLKNHDADLILSDYCVVNENCEVTAIKKFPELECVGTSTFEQALPLLIHQNMAMHGVTYRRELLNKIGYHQTEGVAYTDQEWIFLPILQASSVLHYPYVIYKYLIGREGQSVDSSVITKAMTLQLKHFSKRLDDYAHVAKDISSAKKTYAFNRMKYSMVNTFKCILFGRTTGGFAHELMEIDQKLKTNFPELYYALDCEKLTAKLPFKYIAYWRHRYPNGKKTPFITLIKSLKKLDY